MARPDPLHATPTHAPVAPTKADPATAPAVAPDAAPPALTQRLGRLPPVLDVGEQVVGSEHPFVVGIPINMDRTGVALVTTTIEGEGVFHVEAHTIEALPPLLTTQPLSVRFAPKASGPAKGILHVRAVWPDGHAEEQEIALRGWARTLEEAPRIAAQSPAVVAKMNDEALRDATANLQSEAAVVTEAQDPRPYDQNWQTALHRHKDRATHALDVLIDQRRLGVETVERSAGSFVAPPAETPWWIGLIEVAVAAASEGISGLVVERTLHKLLGHDAINHSVLHAVLEEGFKEATERLTMKEVELARGSEERGEELHGHEGDARTEQKEPSSRRLSTNPTVNFFAVQQKGLIESKTFEYDGIVDRTFLHLLPLLRTHPEAAVAAMSALAQTLTDTTVEATKLQRNSTAAAWVAFKARAHLGTQQIHRAGSKKEFGVSDIEKANDLDADDPVGLGAKAGRGTVGALGGVGALASESPMNLPLRKSVDGVLEIEVLASRHRVQVVDARIDGIPYDIADDLLAMDLKHANLPVKIVVNGRDAEVLRDEEGRVFVHGNAQAFAEDAAPFDAEIDGRAVAEQGEQAGKRLVERVFSKSLRAWGLKQIQVNDVGGKI